MFDPVSPKTCSLCDEGRTTCPLFHDVRDYMPQDIFPHLFERTQRSVLIDNSKKPSWMRQFVDSDEFVYKYIHLLRDPRGMFFSWRQRGRKTELSHWAKRTRALHEELSAPRRDSKLVLYNELAEHPEQTVRDLDCWLGLDYEPAQHAYWRFEHHGFGKNGATLPLMAGAGGADEVFYASMGTQQFHDLRWQQRLDVDTQRNIVQDADVQGVLSDLRLHFTETGLERDE
jgi:hypothetical protein